ncbi:hypothetical protein PW52_06105 [Tamlana sedimentorum]|uniref:Uncharacterized protein n=1 Tax=Neotamlana sedimentorum TaxID=1435349 RepID=A0A0D7WBW2_9FLAO|nr:hypothetical protein [Tamlana sedimentorum]KJD36173.1 hypothetical protein PW52_06105 [Tamlana sedimentorum]
MKTLKVIPILCLLCLSCSGQEKQENKTEPNIKPNENVQVNKEYDEYGNLIKYDSIYSYSYSSKNSLNDSLKFQFQEHFKNHSIFSDSFFDDFFKSDSLTSGLNHKNFFFDGFTNQDQQIKNMMKRMDSIQELFFKKNEPLIPVEPQQENISYKRI